MQATRERILNILKEREQATVDELSRELGLTAVTVRHHLDILRGEGLVAAPIVRRRKSPGRPQHVYTLTEYASNVFPKRYAQLASQVIEEVRAHLSPSEMEQLMKRIGEHMAEQAQIPDGNDFETRLVAAVDFLDELGYMPQWELGDDGAYLLHVANCPYERVALQDHQVCTIDMALLTHLLDTSPRRLKWSVQGDYLCTYTFSPPAHPTE